ncbi:MurR/RpiR family transcriptional regulator [Faecalibacillus intestinalis]|uniref:MurR/RpiR family transcriptional regulator n=1 Tax=Faecalibacillus intestinalis TaxID=1982626 RepID=UPI000E4D5BFA|nr:MurR/RpiR family transcriptional regulator [Coprobacillus sp. OF03-2AA]
MITNKINTILNNSQQGDIDYTICNYIKMNLKEVAFMSIEELARKSYVSKAKISKFIKKLAYDNYIAFKDDCLLELEIRKQVTNTNYFLTKKHLHDSLSWIEKNLMKIEQSQIDYFVRKIKKAKHVYLYGVAYSHLLCKYLQYEGDLFQKDMLVLDENESTIELKEDDLLLVIGIEEDALSKQSSRYLRKLLRSQGRKLLISTQMIDQKMLNYFHETLLLPIDHLEMKERRIMFHCLIDMMMSRYHECA